MRSGYAVRRRAHVREQSGALGHCGERSCQMEASPARGGLGRLRVVRGGLAPVGRRRRLGPPGDRDARETIRAERSPAGWRPGAAPGADRPRRRPDRRPAVRRPSGGAYRRRDGPFTRGIGGSITPDPRRAPVESARPPISARCPGEHPGGGSATCTQQGYCPRKKTARCILMPSIRGGGGPPLRSPRPADRISTSRHGHDSGISPGSGRRRPGRPARRPGPSVASSPHYVVRFTRSDHKIPCTYRPRRVRAYDPCVRPIVGRRGEWARRVRLTLPGPWETPE
jgi:hypothetical protein